MRIKYDSINDFYSKKIKTKKKFKTFLKYTDSNYRPYDPSGYLYKEVLKKKTNEINKEYIELIYSTLIAWNMNQRAAKLTEFDIFYKQIKKEKNQLLKLRNKNITELRDGDYCLIKELVNKLNLTETKTKIVTIAKTLHFICPNTIPPIDNKYTRKFFTQINLKGKTKEDEFLIGVTCNYSELIIKNKIRSKVIDNIQIPTAKRVDDFIIGYVSTKMKSKGE